jgi:surface protein
MYITTEDSEKILTIAGKDGVVMANENSSCLFMSMPNLKAIDFNRCFNTVNAKDLQSIFAGCESLVSIDVSQLDTSNAINLSEMFYGDKKLTSVDVSNFDTSKVTNMDRMFCECKSIKVLDLTSFDTSSAPTTHAMFSQASALEHVYVGDNWTLPDNPNMFLSNCGVSAVERKSA